MSRFGLSVRLTSCSCEAAFTDRLEAEIESGLVSVSTARHRPSRVPRDHRSALLDLGHELAAEIAKRLSRSVYDFEVRVAANTSVGVFGAQLMVGRIEPSVVGGRQGWSRGGAVSCQDREMTVRMSSRGRRSGGERVRLRIGSVAKAVLVTGQAYQDPKDALNEFVSNAADEYIEAGRVDGRVRVVLRRRAQRPFIAVDDEGRGMTPDRLREVARSLFDSAKSGDDRILGEKAIGMLAFQQLGGRLDIVSRAEGNSETWVLRLARGSADGHLERERRRARDTAGTTVFIADVDPDVLRVLTQRKVVDYLRRRRSAALSQGLYSIEVVEGRTAELVTPERPDGLRLDVPARHTLCGRIEFALFVTRKDGKRRRVAVVGRAGTTIIDDIAELEELGHLPWDSDQVAGQVIFPALAQTAGRRAVVRDRDAFPVFLDALVAIEPAVRRAVDRVTAEVDALTNERLADAIRRVFDRVLRELADLDNPMRSLVPVGGDGETPLDTPSGTVRDSSEHPLDGQESMPELPELVPPANDPVQRPNRTTGGEGRRNSHLPDVAPDPEPGDRRSRFDHEGRVVLYNDRHPDYLLVKDDEAALLDYLATLVAKEYVLFNNPRVNSDDLAEEMVRMLIRVRRHLPRRR
jgi:hypothetical protein